MQSKKELVRARAKRWFQSRRQHVGSFLWIADVLGLDPQWVENVVAGMEKHTHLCVHGEWQCVVNILPLNGGGRVRCEQVYEATCADCFQCMVEHIRPDKLVEALESMAELQETDAMLSWRAQTMLKAISNGNGKL